jgi:hypothetical protein
VWGQEPPPAPQADAAAVLLWPPPEPGTSCGAEPVVAPPCADTPPGCFFIRGEYLLMQPRRRAQDFAIVDPNTDGKPQGAIESLFWDAASGVRGGGGYRLGDGWEIGAYYTYLHSHDQRALTAPDGGTLYATLTHPGFVDAVDTAVGDTSLNYQILDVEFARLFSVADSCEVRLSGGGRFAWIDQALDVTYNGQSAFQDHVSSPINFSGAGLRLGAEGRWTVWRRLSFYASGYGSLLSGDFRTRLQETNNAGASVISDVTDRYRKVVPIAELGLGVLWQGAMLHVRVGYEITDWFGMVDSPDFVHDYTNKLSYRTSDLSLDGLAVEVGLDF